MMHRCAEVSRVDFPLRTVDVRGLPEGDRRQMAGSNVAVAFGPRCLSRSPTHRRRPTRNVSKGQILRVNAPDTHAHDAATSRLRRPRAGEMCNPLSIYTANTTESNMAGYR